MGLAWVSMKGRETVDNKEEMDQEEEGQVEKVGGGCFREDR